LVELEHSPQLAAGSFIVGVYVYDEAMTSLANVSAV
jgi:hypothetical protein